MAGFPLAAKSAASGNGTAPSGVAAPPIVRVTDSASMFPPAGIGSGRLLPLRVPVAAGCSSAASAAMPSRSSCTMTEPWLTVSTALFGVSRFIVRLR